VTDWPAWMVPAVLVCGLLLTLVVFWLIAFFAGVLGDSVNAFDLDSRWLIAGTVMQDIVFVLVAVFFARMGTRRVRAWQFGLRPITAGELSTVGSEMIGPIMYALTGALIVGLVWKAFFHGKETQLEQLTHQGGAVLVFTLILGCVVAPICEEIVFRGFVFTALRNWRGTWPAAIVTALLFGAAHAASATVNALIPLAVMGFALCLLYRYTGSLYACILAHALNNSVGIGQMIGATWQIPLIFLGGLAIISLLALAATNLGVVSAERPGGQPAPS
jgi:membrane protease YdiL (CAAX protease family)